MSEEYTPSYANVKAFFLSVQDTRTDLRLNNIDNIYVKQLSLQ